MGTANTPAFDLTGYFKRVGYLRSAAPDLGTLAGLSECHARSIPYEDLEIHLGRKMSLESEDLQRLMVAENRGGYCFQMNLLFAEALEAVGFNVSLLQGRVWLTSRGAVPPPSHLVLRVELATEPWLVDVGFGGGGLRQPIRMQTGEESFQGERQYKLRDDARYGLMLERHDEGDWVTQYSFDQRRCDRVDFLHSNYFLSNSQESFFVQNRVCAIATERGETTLFNRTLRVREGDEVVDTKPESGPHFADLLSEHFGIDLVSTDVKRLWPS
jgi:arylamine N-acetyltransferase